jgi:hypothetical protein
MDDHEARRHPHLSAADCDLLAERIALIDGVTCAQALRQIEEFMSADLGTSIERPTEAKFERVTEQALTESAIEEPLPWACAT